MQIKDAIFGVEKPLHDALCNIHDHSLRIVQVLGYTAKELCKDTNASDEAITGFIEKFLHYMPRTWEGEGPKRTISKAFALRYILGDVAQAEEFAEKINHVSEEDRDLLKLWRQKWNTEHTEYLQAAFRTGLGKERLSPIFLDELHLATTDLWLAHTTRRLGLPDFPEDYKTCAEKDLKVEKQGWWWQEAKENKRIKLSCSALTIEVSWRFLLQISIEYRTNQGDD